MDTTPRLLAPEALASHLQRDDLRLVDLTPAEDYRRGHLPGAVHLDYAAIVTQRPPVVGLLPDPAHLQDLFSRLGIGDDTWVIAYDHEGGGRAARFLWTLEVAGHTRLSLLDGGIHAWREAGQPLSQAPATPEARPFHYRHNPDPLADRDYILAHMQDPDLCLVDARSPAEYAGIDVRAARGGHIPGAINMDWLEFIDRNHALRLHPESHLRARLESRGITPDKQIVVYCHSHHRSALVYWALKTLDYPRVKGYPGSWSDWGNAQDTPIEQG